MPRCPGSLDRVDRLAPVLLAPVRIFLLAALTVGILSGCKLVDQTTFGARPAAPGIDQLSLALKEPGRIPLVVIRFDGSEGLFAEALNTAVDSAMLRKPDVVFDLVTMVPATGTPPQQEAALARAQQDTLQVMDRMADAGADPEHMHLAARLAPDLTTREVRVYVH